MGMRVVQRSFHHRSPRAKAGALTRARLRPSRDAKIASALVAVSAGAPRCRGERDASWLRQRFGLDSFVGCSGD